MHTLNQKKKLSPFQKNVHCSHQKQWRFADAVALDNLSEG